MLGIREDNVSIMNLRMRMFHDANAPLADGLQRREFLSQTDDALGPEPSETDQFNIYSSFIK